MGHFRVPKRRWRVVVEFTTDDDRGVVTADEIADYVPAALRNWNGCYSPDDELFDNVKKVEVLQLRDRPERK